MARLPISIQKIKVENYSYKTRNSEKEITENVEYLFTIEEKGQLWKRSYSFDRAELLDLRNKIDKLLESTSTAEVLKISNDQGKIVDKHYNTDDLCKTCKFKLTNKCKTCLFVLQSPLERKLFLELSKTHIPFETQYPLNWKGERISIDGKSYSNPQNNFKEVLTVADFYIEKRNTKLCVYTDGHTYHERTEEQAQRDRNIDRKLQELGFQVLRYTGKEVNENTLKIIGDIENWLN